MVTVQINMRRCYDGSCHAKSVRCCAPLKTGSTNGLI